MFADDTNLTATGKTVEEVERAMNGDLECVKNWLLANKLSLNVAKPEFLLIGSHYNIRTITAQPNIGIGHNSLKHVTHSKVLGVEIDQFLSWDKHVDSIAKKLTSGIGAIRRCGCLVRTPGVPRSFNKSRRRCYSQDKKKNHLFQSLR